MNDHDIAIARDQIRYIVGVYNNCGDRGRADELAQLFTPDGVMEVTGRTLTGRAEIAGIVNAVASGAAIPDKPPFPLRHQQTTTRIEILDADHAQGWVYFFVSGRGVIYEEGTYIDRYRRTTEGWRIEHRRVKMHWTAYAI